MYVYNINLKKFELLKCEMSSMCAVYFIPN